MERYRKASERLAELDEQRREHQNKFLMLETFIKGIESCPMVLDEFDDKLWAVAVAKLTITIKGKLVYRFKDGAEIEG